MMSTLLGIWFALIITDLKKIFANWLGPETDDGHAVGVKVPATQKEVGL